MGRRKGKVAREDREEDGGLGDGGGVGSYGVGGGAMGWARGAGGG